MQSKGSRYSNEQDVTDRKRDVWKHMALDGRELLHLEPVQWQQESTTAKAELSM